jgi:hypothetical protein
MSGAPATHALIARSPPKVLPADFANDADRLKRFEQEAGVIITLHR